ncbi:recombinase family protein [Amphibacillus marinus]|nr:recombinase family protein [Amphibacillus marinus]
MTVLTSIAQQESESISTNVKMGLKMNMKRGELVGFQGCLSYDYDKETKELIVNKEEAEVVRFIFDSYNQGKGARLIGNELKVKGYKTKRGSTNWPDRTIRGIFRVEDKIKKLIDLHLDGAIDRENYDNNLLELNTDKERLIKKTNELSLTANEEKEMKARL